MTSIPSTRSSPSTDQQDPSTSSFPKSSQVEPKHCWVCFANEDDDYTAQWASPCKCRGTAKWVHKACLQRWIDEKQQGNSSVEVACPQCNNSYIIIYPKSGLFVKVLDLLDHIICKTCPFLAGGILVGSVYWTAVTYGAVTIMQVLGHKEGLNVMEKADPLIMLIGLPTIPVMLMLGRLIRWEDAVLKFWRKHSQKMPLLSMIFPGVSGQQYLPRTPNVSYNSSSSDPVSFTRTICGGLILPTIATIFGKLLFQRVNSNFQRSIIGGIAFIGLKGIFKIYYKQQQFLRQAHRQIKNYETTAAMSASSSTSTEQPQQPSTSSNFPTTSTSNNTNTNNQTTNTTSNNDTDKVYINVPTTSSSTNNTNNENTSTTNQHQHNLKNRDKRKKAQQKQQQKVEKQTSTSFVLNDVLQCNDESDQESEVDSSSSNISQLPPLSSSSRSGSSTSSSDQQQQTSNDINRNQDRQKQRLESTLAADLNESLETFANDDEN